MPKIETVMLRSNNPRQQSIFYSDILGMTKFSDDTVGYGAEQAKIFFPKAEGEYVPKPNDLFWKIALAVPNIELACEQLTKRGVKVGSPRQFQDIGFLAHFADPEGFTIELIEHWFQGRRPQSAVNSALLGGGAHLNLLTLRTTKIENIINTCHNWGMKNLCIQSVENHGFSLYFFAFTSDTPPSLDLHAVVNREWLYQRNYTILEVQHLYKDVDIRQPHSVESGYAGVVFSGLSDEIIGNNELLVTSLV